MVYGSHGAVYLDVVILVIDRFVLCGVVYVLGTFH